MTSRTQTALSLRSLLTMALVGPAVLVIAVVVWLADAAAREALDAALGERLTSIAQSAAALVGPSVLLLEPGDDQTRLAKNIKAKLDRLRARVEVERIVVVRQDGARVLADTGALNVGQEYVRARFDRVELLRVARGERAASILFEGKDGRPYKTGYAPLADESGGVVAFVAVHAPANYTHAIQSLRHTVGGIALLGLALTTLAAFWFSRQLAVPLIRLSESAERIGKGELDTKIPSGGPRESRILAEAMRRMSSSLKDREEEQQLMLAGIAHEVRNPLGGIQLFGGLLSEDLDAADPRRKYVDKILRELGVLTKVVNEFLDFARHRPPDLKALAVRELLEETLLLASQEAERRGVRLSLEADRELIAEWDAEAIERAVLNLVQNAIQAAEHGHVFVRAEAASESHLRIVVEDDGLGVPPEQREDIFKPFFTTKQKGTGLGLALTKKAVLAHGGTIRVEAREGGGARFVLDLPAKVGAR